MVSYGDALEYIWFKTNWVVNPFSWKFNDKSLFQKFFAAFHTTGILSGLVALVSVLVVGVSACGCVGFSFGDCKLPSFTFPAFFFIIPYVVCKFLFCLSYCVAWVSTPFFLLYCLYVLVVFIALPLLLFINYLPIILILAFILLWFLSDETIKQCRQQRWESDNRKLRQTKEQKQIDEQKRTAEYKRIEEKYKDRIAKECKRIEEEHKKANNGNFG